MLSPPLVVNRPSSKGIMKPLQQRYEESSQCGRSHCKTCMHIKTDTNFTSAMTSENFFACVTANSRTSNVVDLIACFKCKKQYVGKMKNPLHQRMNGHRSDYYCKLPDKPVTEPFNSTGHTFNDASVMAIEHMCSADLV